jgi:hypothetical protein
MADATNKSIFARLDTSLMKATKPLDTAGNQEGVKQGNTFARIQANKNTWKQGSCKTCFPGNK